MHERVVSAACDNKSDNYYPNLQLTADSLKTDYGFWFMRKLRINDWDLHPYWDVHWLSTSRNVTVELKLQLHKRGRAGAGLKMDPGWHLLFADFIDAFKDEECAQRCFRYRKSTPESSGPPKNVDI